LHPNPILLAVSTLLCAPFVGSFLGTLILRLPEGRPVFLDRSRCEACGQTRERQTRRILRPAKRGPKPQQARKLDE